MANISFYKSCEPPKSNHRFNITEQTDEPNNDYEVTEGEISLIGPNMRQINYIPTNTNILLFFEKVTKCGHIACKLVDTELPDSILKILSRTDPIDEPQLIIPSFSILRNLLGFGLKKEDLVLKEFHGILKNIIGKLMVANTNYNCVNAVIDLISDFSSDPIQFSFFYESGVISFLFFFIGKRHPLNTIALVLESLYKVLKLNNKFWNNTQNGEVSTWRLVCDNEIIPILFDYLNESDNNIYINDCQLIGYLSFNNEYMFEKMQQEYFDLIINNLLIDDMDHQNATLDMIAAMISTDTLAKYWIEYPIFPALIDLCDNAAFQVQKSAFKIISNIFTYYYKETTNYIIKLGTFNFFLKFLETENINIIDRTLECISTILNFLSNNNGYDSLKILYNNSQETFEMINNMENEEDISEQIQESICLINSIIDDMEKH